MSEYLTDALSRLDLMRHDHGQTWDLSKNDEAAISAVLDSHAALRARVAELERVIEWALGERGDFPSLPDDWPKRKFYWRTELRERAFGKSKAK